ncbi:MAG: class I SAM-dependent methyltransferase [Planctomycetota bacterium]|nr:class I SAM-dependent methyltransferase [Planctomycetota bacterium]MDG1983082.1 class I SAM-dependent methyltransferase [Planctomycetota bacterium]
MSSATTRCPLCAQEAAPAGSTDFNKSGADIFAGTRQFPVSEERVHFDRCGSCGFMFTEFFNGWDESDFKRRVYNQAYVRADPPFAGERPARLADYLAATLEGVLGQVSLLDFGAGDGRMVALLRERGLVKGSVFDPYHAESARPGQPFDVVTAFEVVEHVVDQRALFEELEALTAPRGVLVLSTLLQPADIEVQGASWWYACPRNGHLGFHTAASLSEALRRVGLELLSLSEELHVAFRSPGELLAAFRRSDHDLAVSGAPPTRGGGESLSAPLAGDAPGR